MVGARPTRPHWSPYILELWPYLPIASCPHPIAHAALIFLLSLTLLRHWHSVPVLRVSVCSFWPFLNGGPHVATPFVPSTGPGWVRTGHLKATIIVPPSRGKAIAPMTRALQTKSQPPRTHLYGLRILPPSRIPRARLRLHQMENRKS